MDNKNITFDEYRKGKWETDNTSSEELFHMLAPHHHDLIEGLKIGKLLGSIGNNYKKVRINITAEDKSYDHFGIEIIRKDYYKYLKNFCLFLRLV